MIIHILINKLDFNTIKEWEGIQRTDIPTFEEFQQFFNNRCQLLELLESNRILPKTNNLAFQKHITTGTLGNQRSGAYIATIKRKCSFCKQTHFIAQCCDFLKLEDKNKLNEAKKLDLCTNCVRKTNI